MRKPKYRLSILWPCLLLALLTAGCLKSLDDEGVAEGTVIKGQVVESTAGHAAAGMNVLVTNGERQGEETVTAADGSFALTVTFEQLNEGYHLLLTADSLYRTTEVPLPDIGIGLKEYDMQTLVVDGPELAQITTDAVSGITKESAVSGGTIVDDGRSHVHRRGICWATSVNPTIVNSHADAGSGSGHFVASLDGLQSGTTYHVRAYAENSVGIAYGQEVTFTTQSGVPVVTTASASDITQHSVTCGGVVTGQGSSAVTARGVCYSTTSVQPTVNDAHTTNGTGTGSYTSTITGLQSGTTYYIRAYATNAQGTGYGEVKTATTF